MKSKIFKYIYAMLCLLPAIAVGVTCVYVANNENAYQSYSGVSASNETYDNVEYEDMHLGANYRLVTPVPSDLTFSSDFRLEVRTSEVIVDSTTIISDIGRFVLYNGSGVVYFYTADSQGSGSGNYYQLSVSSHVFEFTFDGFILLRGTSNLMDSFYQYSYTDYFYVDNVFYYSLDKVENSSVFSWVKSNFLYEGVNNFVGIFGGTNSNISFYLTWVLTISLCYLGFEVLMLFINMARNLIHSFTDKERW